MLAERKKKLRLPQDPNNKNWSEDTSSFGRKMLEKMGWREGCGLGARLDGPTSHIKISVKEDLLGIGASRRDAETGWLNNSKSYQEVLDRLSKSVGDSDSETEEEMAKDSKKSKKDKSEKKDKKEKRKDKSKNKKEKKVKKEKKEKREKSKDVSKDVSKEPKDAKEPKKTVSIPSEPQIHSVTTNARAHRAKFIRNKAVSSYSQTHLKEILGGLNTLV